MITRSNRLSLALLLILVGGLVGSAARAETSSEAKLKQALAAHRAVVISTGAAGKLASDAQKRLPEQVVAVPMSTAKDRKLLSRYGVRSEPALVVLAPCGQVVSRIAGKMSPASVDAAIVRALQILPPSGASGKTETQIRRALASKQAVLLLFADSSSESARAGKVVAGMEKDLKGFVTIVKASRSDKALARWNSLEKTPTVILASTKGVVSYRASGAITQEKLMGALAKMFSVCGSGGCAAR